MSKKNTKKQARKANILTLGVTDLAPIVGSIIADKDTIIIKKMSNGAAAVFFSDQNGNVIGTGDAPTPPKNPEPPKEKPSNIDLASLTQDDILYLKNRLYALEYTNTFDTSLNSTKHNDLKLIIYVNDKKLEYPDFSTRIFVKQGDIIKIKSSDYPNVQLAVDGVLALGDGVDFVREITQFQETIFFEDIEELPSLPDLPPTPADPPVDKSIGHSEEGIVWQKDIRVYFPTPTTYSVAGETKTGNGWTDIRIFVNGEDLFINGAQTGEGNLYAAEENLALMYGDNGGVPVNLVLNFSDVEEGMTLTFSQVD